jgi:hypothetical protein
VDLHAVRRTKGASVMWCDDFDMDLPRVVPEALPILQRIPDSIVFRTHGHEWGGKLNHPSCWNTYDGLAAFFTLDPTRDPAPSGYMTGDPIVSCTWTEAVRDAWCHDFLLVVDGDAIFDFMRLYRTAFEPLMYHVRGWRQVSPREVFHARRRVVRALTNITADVRAQLEFVGAIR